MGHCFVRCCVFFPLVYFYICIFVISYICIFVHTLDLVLHGGVGGGHCALLRVLFILIFGYLYICNFV